MAPRANRVQRAYGTLTALNGAGLGAFVPVSHGTMTPVPKPFLSGLWINKMKGGRKSEKCSEHFLQRGLWW